MSTTKDLGRLEAEYRARAAEIRADESLSWEKRELKIKALGDDYHRQRRELEEDTAA